jgi:hypothetical protein
MVRAMNAPLAALLQRAFDERGDAPAEYGAAGAYRAAVEAILTVFDDDLPMTAAILDEDPGQLTAEAAALVRIREIGRTVMEGRWPLAKPPAKIPDTSVAGESMQDFDLLVTVRVYGAGSAMDAAGALCTGRGTFDLPGDGEVEILTARPADWAETSDEQDARGRVGPLGLPEVEPGEIEREFGAHDGDD